MYLALYGIRSEPVMLPVREWSVDACNGDRYGRRQPKPQRPICHDFRDWSVEKVQFWLKEKGLKDEYLQKLKDEEVDGNCLLEMNHDKDLRELIPRLQQRCIVIRAVDVVQDKLRDWENHLESVEKKEFDFHFEELQVQLYLGAFSMLGILNPLTKGTHLSRVSLITYHGPAIDRWGGQDDDATDRSIPFGIPFHCLDMHEVKVAFIHCFSFSLIFLKRWNLAR